MKLVKVVLVAVVALGSATFISGCAPMRFSPVAWKDMGRQSLFHPKEATGYSLSRTYRRHNSKCELYKPSPKWACDPRDGIACNKCGG